MDIKPIPAALLGDSFTLLTPAASGTWNETVIGNVRIARTETIADCAAQKALDNTAVTVWFDCTNSSPKADFSAGMKARYHGEIYEITEQRVYSSDRPHHCKFKARKIGGEYTEAN